ncbi:MAG: TlyA family RNA methyltransferase [Thermodesulfobacteriota bacterium]
MWEGEHIKGRERIDLLLVRRGLVPSRARAQSLLMSGVVFVKGTRVDKAGTLVAKDSEIIIKEDSRRYVGRGGIKLEAALKRFKINVNDKVALDIGASTGGFTDCLLQFGARKVYAIDVGHGQIDWGLRQDRRVVVMEKVNARYLKPEDIGELVDISTIDVSFISLTLIIPRVKNLLKPKGILIALIKPQFEVGKGEVGKKGVVRNESKYAAVIEKITSCLQEASFDVVGVMPSPILGADGNKEFLIVGVKN